MPARFLLASLALGCGPALAFTPPAPVSTPEKSIVSPLTAAKSPFDGLFGSLLTGSKPAGQKAGLASRYVSLGPDLKVSGAITNMALPLTEANVLSLDRTIQVSPIGVGTWAWGNKLLWGYDTKDDEEIQRAFDYILSQ